MIKILCTTLLFLIMASAVAGHEIYMLPWKDNSEQLIYHSCGCADSCWVAELRESKTNKLKATLRSDCSRLLAIYPANSPERELSKKASEINDQVDKMEMISSEMKNLVEGIRASKK